MTEGYVISSVNALYKSFPAPIYELSGTIIPWLPFNLRNCVIKCCEAQTFPDPSDNPSPSTALEHIILPLLSYRVAFRGESPFLLSLLKPFSNSPSYSGLLLDLFRSTPVQDADLEIQRLKSWMKEISCCESEKKGPSINFKPIFSPEYFQDSMFPGILPANGYMHRYIYGRLKDWRSSMCGQIHFPRASRKTMSRDTVRHYRSSFGDETVNSITQEDYLRIEAEHRVSIGGCCEIRQKWYPAKFKPRTYYAQGGSLYKRTYCLQGLFTKLVDCFPVVNHISRLQPSRLHLLPGQHFRAYDLTSFTSKMEEQINFLENLAEFCYGYTITMVTAIDGVVQEDLGHLISEYNHFCNIWPEVSYERFDEDLVHHESFQRVAGMLGVYGNLMTCTFAHGAVMSTFGEDEDQVNIAGDDGLVPEDQETVYVVEAAIDLLGVHERSKEYISTEVGATALKRPLRHFDSTRVMLKEMLIWPNIATLRFVFEDKKDPRFTYYASYSRTDKVNIIGAEIARMLRSIYRSGQDYFRMNDDLVVVDAYLKNLEELTERRFNLSLKGGSVIGDKIRWPSLPSRFEEYFDDPRVRKAETMFKGAHTVAFRSHIPFDREMMTEHEFSCNSNKVLKFLEQIGIVEKKAEVIHLTGQRGYETFLSCLKTLTPIVYRYCVVKSVPDQVRSVLDYT